MDEKKIKERVNEQIKEKLEKNYLHCRLIIEVLGKPKEHVEESLKTYLDAIKKEAGENFFKSEVMEAQKTGEAVQDGVEYYTSFAELEVLFKDIQSLAGFCFDYMPSSVEIIKPDSLVLRNVDISNIMNDLQAKTHVVDGIVKSLKSENQFLRRNMKNLLKNFILISLKIKSNDAKALSKLSGVKEGELQKFLDELVHEKTIKKEGGGYRLV